MANRKFLIHYLVLTAVILLGAILRFWNLDLKPYWQDEVITALFSLGRSYKDVPLDVVLPLNQVEQIFTLNPSTSCAQIAHNVATQSTHPPLFFCLMHKWAGAPLVGAIARGWVWSLRALPALCGVGAIAALYCLNRVAFSPAAGLGGAALMAVSPFAVYLSQEARHYTLPILVITLALLALIQIQRDLFQAPHKLRPWVWMAWVAMNIIGLYIHYFCILAAIAQLGTLVGLMYWRRRILPRYSWVATGLAVATVGCSYLPWLPVMLRHFSHSKHNWLPSPNNIAPLFQTLISWLFMVIALPVEDQPLWIAVPSGLLMVMFGSWLAWHVAKGLWQLWSTPATHLATLTLLGFTFWVLLEFFVIAYLLGKDLTSVPRYDFVYYPSICALLGASLLRRGGEEGRRGGQGGADYSLGGSLRFEFVGDNKAKLPTALLEVPSGSSSSGTRGSINISPHLPLPPSPPPLPLSLLVGILSCIFVVSNWVLQKPFYPQQVAQNLNQEPSVPLMVVVGYIDHEAVALGLSFALALDKIKSEGADFALFNPTPEYRLVWEHLSVLPPPKVPKLNLWVIGPGLRQRDYPQHLALSSQAACTLDPENFHRIGVPYQLYRCIKL